MSKDVYVDLLRESIKKNANSDCFHIKRNGSYTTWRYSDFCSDLNKLVSMLKSLGFNKGVNAAVIGANCPEWVMAYHGPILAGGCIVPIDPNIPAAEITEIIRLTESRVVFCSATYVSLFEKLAGEFDFIKKIVVLEPDAPKGRVSFADFIAGGDSGSDAFAQQFAPDDPLAILFTSGTTGKAKGVVLNQRNLTTAPNHGVPRMKVGPSDTMIAILPLHHVFGCAACIAATLPTGMDIVFIPAIKGPLILEGLNDKKVSILPAVPQMLELFYDNIQRKVNAGGPIVTMVFGILKMLSSILGNVFGMGFRKKLFGSVHKSFGGNIQCIISGGSSLKKNYFDGFRLMGFNIVEGYGLTETFGPITLCPIDDPRQGSVGKVLEGNDMEIFQPNEEGIGEVLFRGETVFPGYYNNEKITSEAFDSDKWFHTGDLGRVTDDGFLYLTGRAKDIIVLSSGKNVYPDELEEYYSLSPYIEEIGVLGIEDNNEEIVGAVIVPDKDFRARHSIEKATELMNEELARMGRDLPTYKKIGAFVVSYHALPRTTTRKIIKNELKKMFEKLKRSEGVQETSHIRLTYLESAMMESEEFKTIVDYVAKASPKVNTGSLTPRSHLQLDCMLDSLKSLDLICMLEEKYNCSVSMEDLVNIETMADAVTLIQDLRAGKAGNVGENKTEGVKERLKSDSGGEELNDTTALSYHYLPGLLLGIGRMLWGIRVTGVRNIPPDRPVIFASNHESALDIMIIIGALPWSIRKKTYTIGKKELLEKPLSAFAAKRSNMVPVEREGDIVEALKASHKVLDSGKNLIIFPEGTRTRTGETGKFKSGIGTLMMETGAAVIPLRIKGAYALQPAGKAPDFFAGRKHATHLAFGEMLTLDSLKQKRLLKENYRPEDIASAVEKVVREM
ncbi:MAG: AMP-binding protein [Chitinivibrionales bacterium]|nr:AMP-binding protein [Chitinivibrionales bacterium]